MTRNLANLIFRAKAVLCVIILFQAPLLIVGCGQNVPGATSSLPASGELSDVLAGTRFANPSSVEVNEITKTFRVIQSDGTSSISGSYTDVAGEIFITQFSVNNGAQIAALSLNTNHEVTQITMQQQGTIYQNHTGNTQPVGYATAPHAPSAKGLDAYTAANADLLAQAQAADAQLAVKAGQQGFFWIPFLTAFVLIPAGVFVSVTVTLQTIAAIASLLKK